MDAEQMLAVVVWSLDRVTGVASAVPQSAVCSLSIYAYMQSRFSADRSRRWAVSDCRRLWQEHDFNV